MGDAVEKVVPSNFPTQEGLQDKELSGFSATFKAFSLNWKTDNHKASYFRLCTQLINLQNQHLKSRSVLLLSVP